MKKRSQKFKTFIKRAIQLASVTFLLFVFFLYNYEWGKVSGLHIIDGLTMGTYYRVQYYHEDSVSFSEEEIRKKIESDLLQVNHEMSTYLTDSEISLLNKSEARVSFQLSPWFSYVLKASLEIAKKTDGAYDPTVGPLVNLWGFGPDVAGELPRKAVIKETLKFVGFEKIHLKDSVVSKDHDKIYVDLSSIAKGFAVDRVFKTLKHLGFKNFLVDIGGELKASGKKGGSFWKVAIEEPFKSGSFYGFVYLDHKAIATSGNYRNIREAKDGYFSHTIDSKSGNPIKNQVISVTVIADECMRADVYATAILVMGEKKGLAFANKEGVAAFIVIYDGNDFKFIKSNSFKKLLKRKEVELV